MLIPLSLSIQLTALAVLSASVPVIAREPAVSVRARAAMEVSASVGTAASVTSATVRRDPPNWLCATWVLKLLYIALACNV